MHAKVSQQGYYHMPFEVSKSVRDAFHERVAAFNAQASDGANKVYLSAYDHFC